MGPVWYLLFYRFGPTFSDPKLKKKLLRRESVSEQVTQRLGLVELSLPMSDSSSTGERTRADSGVFSNGFGFEVLPE